jgi:hypothetical protein
MPKNPLKSSSTGHSFKKHQISTFLTKQDTYPSTTGKMRPEAPATIVEFYVAIAGF